MFFCKQHSILHTFFSKIILKFNTVILRHRTFLKGAIDGVSGDHFRIGLYTFRDTVKTESDYQVVGKLSDFSSDHEVTLKGSSINIVVKPGYVLENLDLRTDAAFICQHDWCVICYVTLRLLPAVSTPSRFLNFVIIPFASF